MTKKTETATGEINLRDCDLRTTNNLKVLRKAVCDITDNLQREDYPSRHLGIAITRLVEAGVWLMMEIHRGVKP